MANKLPIEKKVAVISMLAEGSSIRAIERITGVNQNTIMSLGRRVGDACAKIMDVKMRNLPCKQIEVDEIKSVPVHEVFNGKTVWQGDVEVFGLTGHPKAQRCCAWSYDEPEQFIAILEIPPVDSAESAVKVGVAYQLKKANRNK